MKYDVNGERFFLSGRKSKQMNHALIRTKCDAFIINEGLEDIFLVLNTVDKSALYAVGESRANSNCIEYNIVAGLLVTGGESICSFVVHALELYA